ncbi:MAG: RagB/SusD family nutrient uptake outer membrane protein, partial [Mucilaginibacter sp.]|nr:RagB/SusD family nutrient uptake outer membrane protein [Mucilaginibacter sp.]
MKKFIYAILSLTLLTGVFSCKKYLELVPAGQLLLTKSSDYRLLLDQITKTGKSNGFYATYSTDAMVDDDMVMNSYSVTTYAPAMLNAFQFAPQLYMEAESDVDWEAMYNQIYVANLVIANVMTATGAETEKRQLIAEARVHRAYAYLILVSLYAKQYDPATAASDPGVPIRMETDFEEKLVRKSVQQVYDYLTADLKLAIPDLPLVPELPHTNRPVKAAALTILARASQYMNHQQEAHDYADESLKTYSTLSDYNKLLQYAYFLPVIYWTYPEHFKNSEVLLEKTAISSNLMFMSQPLLNLYDFTNDMRASTTILDGKLYGIDYGYLSIISGNPYKGPSVAESYLIRAEASARLGNADAAMADVNTLRKARYKTGSVYTLTASSAEQALLLVKEERRRELAFCG